MVPSAHSASESTATERRAMASKQVPAQLRLRRRASSITPALTLAPPSVRASGRSSVGMGELGSVGDHLLKIVACIALLASELKELGDFAAQLALGGGADDSDTAAGCHLKQPLIA